MPPDNNPLTLLNPQNQPPALTLPPKKTPESNVQCHPLPCPPFSLWHPSRPCLGRTRRRGDGGGERKRTADRPQGGGGRGTSRGFQRLTPPHPHPLPHPIPIPSSVGGLASIDLLPPSRVQVLWTLDRWLFRYAPPRARLHLYTVVVVYTRPLLL